jgi:1-acyl-sn-glycerol-3-phosphate acyltransferase
MVRLALAAGVPVVPVAMVGTDRIQPPETLLPKTAPLSIRIGEPLDFSRYREAVNDHAVLRSVTDKVMKALSHLSGQ